MCNLYLYPGIAQKTALIFTQRVRQAPDPCGNTIQLTLQQPNNHPTEASLCVNTVRFPLLNAEGGINRSKWEKQVPARLDAPSLLFGSAPSTSCARRCAQPMTSSVAGGCDKLPCRSATCEGNEAHVRQHHERRGETRQVSPSSAGLHLQKEANNVAGHILCTEHLRCSKPWHTVYIHIAVKRLRLSW